LPSVLFVVESLGISGEFPGRLPTVSTAQAHFKGSLRRRAPDCGTRLARVIIGGRSLMMAEVASVARIVQAKQQG